MITSNHSMIVIEFIAKGKLIQIKNFALILRPNFQHMIWWEFYDPSLKAHKIFPLSYCIWTIFISCTDL